MARKLRCCRRAERDARRVVGRPFDAAVPRAVVALAVAVVLAVRLVVLVVVRDEVAQREAVVRGDEVDADAYGRRPVVVVEVGAAGEAVGELAEGLSARRASSRARVSRYLPFHSDHSGGKLPTW